jgi:hypothetical protein
MMETTKFLDKIKKHVCFFINEKKKKKTLNQKHDEKPTITKAKYETVENPKP